MGRFFPVYIRRSDGKIEIKSRHRSLERNEPTKEQLDKTPDTNGISDFYREVDIDEQKHLDWRRKLGGMLARDLGQSNPEIGYILAAFPEHFRLYEHVKRAIDDSKAKTAKNHAGGGNERQDAYLYGHPLGRKKRYRSPADFYPHLYWLATAADGDRDNCACKICCPEELDDKSQTSGKAVAPEPKRAIKPAPSTNVEAPQNQPAPTTTKPQQSAADARPADREVIQTPTPQPARAAAPSQQPQRPQASQPQATFTEDQRIDLSPNSFLFRQGEMVWFKKGTAWGLGVISRRWQQDGMKLFTVQPLSHPYMHPPQVNAPTEDLRPWLAWSVPDFTHPGLNGLPITFETAEWPAINAGAYGSGELEVDGSILAAKAIDCSYTPMQPLASNTLPSGVTETTYNSIYMGAERFWRGDVVRLRSNGGLDVLVLNAIVERSTTQHATPPALVLQGDIFALQQNPGPAGDTSFLPPRMRNDLARRNQASMAKLGVSTGYLLRTPGASVEPIDVKGRWYEALLLAPVLAGSQQAAAAELAAGQLGEMGLKMNARLDCQRRGPGDSAAGPTTAVQSRRSTRREAIGAAVPQTFRIIDQGGEV